MHTIEIVLANVQNIPHSWGINLPVIVPLGSDFNQDKLLFSPAAKIRYGPNGANLGFDNGKSLTSTTTCALLS